MRVSEIAVCESAVNQRAVSESVVSSRDGVNRY